MKTFSMNPLATLVTDVGLSPASSHGAFDVVNWKMFLCGTNAPVLLASCSNVAVGDEICVTNKATNSNGVVGSESVPTCFEYKEALIATLTTQYNPDIVSDPSMFDVISSIKLSDNSAYLAVGASNTVKYTIRNCDTGILLSEAEFNVGDVTSNANALSATDWVDVSGNAGNFPGPANGITGTPDGVWCYSKLNWIQGSPTPHNFIGVNKGADHCVEMVASDGTLFSNVARAKIEKLYLTASSNLKLEYGPTGLIDFQAHFVTDGTGFFRNTNCVDSSMATFTDLSGSSPLTNWSGCGSGTVQTDSTLPSTLLGTSFHTLNVSRLADSNFSLEAALNGENTVLSDGGEKIARIHTDVLYQLNGSLNEIRNSRDVPLVVNTSLWNGIVASNADVILAELRVSPTPGATPVKVLDLNFNAETATAAPVMTNHTLSLPVDGIYDVEAEMQESGGNGPVDKFQIIQVSY